jgi:exonuclease III
MTRIATFNVNGVNARLPVLVKWLAQSQCDVVCLQETKTPDEKFPAEAIEKAGYGAIWHGQNLTTALRSSLAAPHHSRPDAACPEIPTTPIAATSRRRSAASLSDAFTFPMATRRQARNSTTYRTDWLALG